MKRTILLTLVLAVASTAVVAAPPAKLAPNSKGQVILSWDEFIKITGFDPTRKGGGQVLTVPWKQVKDLLGVEVDVLDKETVDLPWQEFKKLLEWSIKNKTAKDEPPPPTDYIVSSSNYAAALSADGAELTLTVSLQVLRKKGWKRIPVLPASVAVKKATLPEGVHLNSASGVYEILTEKSGKLDIVLVFAVAVQKSGGINRVSFAPPLPTASILDIRVARENVDVKVAGAQSLTAAEVKVEGKTAVAAAIATGVAVDISWEPELPKVAAAPTKLYAQTRTLVSVADGVLLCQEMVYYNILYTGVRELKLQAPAGVSVLNVSGRNVQDWRVDDKGAVSIVLSAEAIGSYTLRIAYEAPLKDKADIPVIHAVGAAREKGYVGVVALANVEIGAGKVVGATAIDVRQLPADIAAMTNQPILLGFRYVGEKFTIPLTVKKHKAVSVLVTVVDSALFTGMQLNDGRRMTKVVYSVRNNRNQFLRLKMPAGASIWSASVAGNTVAPAKDEKGNLLVPLVRSKSGAQELASFSVELVYVETPATEAPAKGKLRVDLPVCSGGVPVIHVMYSVYLPAEGEYTIGWGKSGFTGVLRLVEKYTSLSSGRGAAVVRRDAAKQTAGMQEAFNRRVDAAAKAAGAAPIRVRLPINGKLFKLEKVLAMPADKLFFEVQYRNWKVAK